MGNSLKFNGLLSGRALGELVSNINHSFSAMFAAMKRRRGGKKILKKNNISPSSLSYNSFNISLTKLLTFIKNNVVKSLSLEGLH